MDLTAMLGERFRRDEALAKHTSLRIGGPAAFWAEVRTEDELTRVVEMAGRAGRPVVVVGLGSNVLFPDEGLDAVVVRLRGEFEQWRPCPRASDVEPARYRVGAGALNAHLVRGLLADGMVGMEFLALIPGTFGGAVAMNAGTREQELSSILRRVDLVSPDEPGKVKTLTTAELQMSYRHAALPPGSVVVGGTIELAEGDTAAATERVRADKSRRNETQPYRLASVGSTFANPEGDYAGRLIEAVGLKDTAIGGARISPLHANFFINEADASADDFLRLMALARVKVRERFGVELRPEVRFVGFDGFERLRAIEAELTAASSNEGGASC